MFLLRPQQPLMSHWRLFYERSLSSLRAYVSISRSGGKFYLQQSTTMKQYYQQIVSISKHIEALMHSVCYHQGSHHLSGDQVIASIRSSGSLLLMLFSLQRCFNQTAIENWSCTSLQPSFIYRKISNKKRTESQSLNVSRLVMQLPLPNPLKPGVKWRMKMKLEQALLQRHMSDQQICCLPRCDLY